mgnify:CR=1 FL=1
MNIVVWADKGGVGKTTTTFGLGSALATVRHDRVIAVDANPDRGTLAERIGRPSGKTVRDLVRARADVQGFNDISEIVGRDQTRLDGFHLPVDFCQLLLRQRACRHDFFARPRRRHAPDGMAQQPHLPGRAKAHP